MEIVAIYAGNVMKYTDIYTLSESADFIYLKKALHIYYSTKNGFLQLFVAKDERVLVGLFCGLPL
jgi:hypothetical protein